MTKFTKRDHPANFYISLSKWRHCWRHIRHVCWHYKSVYFIVTCHRQRPTTYANVRTRAFCSFCAHYVNYCRQSRFIWHNFVKVGDNWIKICNLAYIGTYNRRVKNRLKILSRLWKNEKSQIPSVFDSVYSVPCLGPRSTRSCGGGPQTLEGAARE